MKKILIFLAATAFIFNSAIARDYVELQVKEMKHAQKYGTTKKIVTSQNQNIKNTPNVAISNIKDPKIMKFSNNEKISQTKYNEKLKKDESEYKEYEKLLSKKHSKYYTTQADAKDFYTLYRVAEKIIRANNLDYMNWRICIQKSAQNVNAYSDGTNLIVVTTALYDSFSNNEDALAMVIGHEMGHALLGHTKRSGQLQVKMERYRKAGQKGNYVSALTYIGMMKKYQIDAKNMEFAADLEGAKLAMHAGYDINKGADVFNFFSLTELESDRYHDHPLSEKRIANLRENSKYFPNEWEDIGKYNIYHSQVMPVELSSDRKSIVISAPKEKLNPDKYYTPETMPELFARLGYMYYVNGKFEKSLKYFDKLFEIEQTNAPAYLYASYAAEYLYKSGNDSKYLNLSKDYAQKAYALDSKNKYIKEQVDSL